MTEQTTLNLRIRCNSGCWNEIADVHGLGGVPHSVTNLDECLSICVNDTACVAIDWDPSNAASKCWTLTEDYYKATQNTGYITHYVLNRTCLSKSYFYFTHCLFNKNDIRAQYLRQRVRFSSKCQIVAQF